MGHPQTAVFLRAYLEVLADDAGTAVPAADGALRTLVGHVLLQVASQHSLVAQVTLELLEATLLQVGLGEVGGEGEGSHASTGGLCVGEGSHRCPSAVHSSCSPGLSCDTVRSPWRSPCDWQYPGRTAGEGEGGCCWLGRGGDPNPTHTVPQPAHLVWVNLDSAVFTNMARHPGRRHICASRCTRPGPHSQQM